MAKKTSTIKISDLDRMINEEMSKIKKANEIRARLAVVNEELKRLSESESVDEVEVGGTRNGEAYYEKGVPVPKFEKKGTHLKEDEPMMGDEQVPETFEEKLAAIGRELDLKLTSMDTDEDPMADADGALDMGDAMPADDMSVDGGEEMATTDDIEIPATDSEAPTSDAPEKSDEEGGEEGDEEIEIDEASIEVEKAGDPFLKKPKEGMNQMDGVGTKTVSEEVTEEAKVKTEADEETEEECETMEEDKKAVNESRDVLGKKKNNLLAKELERMKNLAGL